MARNIYGLRRIPHAPEIVLFPGALAAAAASSTGIDLTTDPVPFATQYVFQQSDDGLTGWVTMATVTDPAATATLLSNDTEYFFRVRAENPEGPGPWSDVVAATTDVLPAPSDLGAEPVSATAIDLAWADNSADETAFLIERSPDGATWTQIDSVPADTTTYSDTGLDPATLYYYQVRAENAGGDSAYSVTTSATTQFLQTPVAGAIHFGGFTSSAVTDFRKTPNAGAPAFAGHASQIAVTGSVFVQDSFTEISDAAFSAHTTGEVGAAWTIQAGSALRVDSNSSVYVSGFTGAASQIATASGTPASANYDIECDLVFINNDNAPHQSLLVGRFTDTDNFYSAGWDSTSVDGWYIYRRKLGIGVMLQSSAVAFPTGTTKHLLLKVRDTNPTLELLIDGVSVISDNDAQLTTAGNVGFSMNDVFGEDATHGIHLDNFTATNR